METLNKYKIEFKGPVDRGYERSLYFHDPNGIKLELMTWKTPLPVGSNEAEVIARAQKIRENDGAYNIEDEHVRKAMAELKQVYYRIVDIININYFEVPPELHELYKNRFGFDITEYNGKDRLGLPVPGTFVIGQDGIILSVFAKTDYKMRMEPEDILEALKATR